MTDVSQLHISLQVINTQLKYHKAFGDLGRPLIYSYLRMRGSIPLRPLNGVQVDDFTLLSVVSLILTTESTRDTRANRHLYMSRQRTNLWKKKQFSINSR
jgi:phosphoribosyl-AMP cyclohydrolase